MNPADLTLADFTCPELLADPYPMYAALRQHDPIHLDRQSNTWMATRYCDVTAILGDRRFSVRRPKQGSSASTNSPIERALSLQMLFQDPPDHTRLRGLFAKAFTPHRVERLRPQVLAVVRELLDRSVAAGGASQVDFVRELAEPLPVIVISQLLGVPSEAWQKMTVWSYSLGRFFTGGAWSQSEAEKMHGDVLSLVGYIGQLVESKRTGPADDLISDLLSAENLGDRLNTEELTVNLMLLFAAGHLTTTHLLGNAMLALSQAPAQWVRLVQDPTLALGAVNETLRYDAAVQAVTRQACEDVELGDRVVRAGEEVVVFLGSANRDEAQFLEPNCFDVGRRGGRSLAFGHGIHACLGAALARLEGEVLFAELAQRFPSMRVIDQQPMRLRNYMIRGVTSLPISWSE